LLQQLKEQVGSILRGYKEHALVRNEYLFDELLGGNVEKLSFSELKTGLGLLAGKYGKWAYSLCRHLCLRSDVISKNNARRIKTIT